MTKVETYHACSLADCAQVIPTNQRISCSHYLFNTIQQTTLLRRIHPASFDGGVGADLDDADEVIALGFELPPNILAVTRSDSPIQVIP